MASASSRYGVDPGPEGAGLVQELLNTFAGGKTPEPDLLGAGESAAAWVESVPALAALDLTGLQADRAGLRSLRELRDQLRQTVAREVDASDPDASGAVGRRWAGSVEVVLEPGGRTELRPRGSGWERAVALTLVQAHLAQLDGTWQRLKVCRNPRCKVAFYDHSRNRSGVWHDVRVCGNAANLRASRARKRLNAPAAADS